MKKTFLLFAMLISLIGVAYALTAGDIAIISVHTDVSKYVAFVALEDIPANSTISFTDNGWNATTQTWRSGEGTIQWSNAAVTSKGSVIVLSVNTSPYSASVGSVTTNTSFNLSASGDQVLAYEGTTAPNTNNHATWLFAYSTRNFVYNNDSNSSDCPTALTGASVAMRTVSTDVDNSYFANGSTAQTTVTLTGDKATLLALFTDSSLYYTNNNAITLPTYSITVTSGSANQPPAISNIVQTPSTDIINTTTVSVSATITDSDGTVTSAQLRWGTATGVYGNTIGMTASGSTYTTNSNIPAQTAGTTVYYVIDATDDDLDTTTSSEQSYTVIAPATTTIPYTEDFSAGWGQTYRYDIAGTKPWYIYNNDNASCNGYGSTLEEHWLVLPGINFNNYSNERMTFNTIATHGTIDANNYLKLLYSNNYPGLGDPTSSTWTEIAFANGGIGGGETSSGVLDLSGISGTNVYLAFKYYSTNSPTRWEIDDINIYLATPLITVNPTTLTGFTYQGTGPSTAQTFTVSGADLTADIVLTAPTNYEISLSENTGYTSFLTLTAAKLGVNETTIYVRLKAGLAIGTYNNEDITLSSSGATNKTVTCSGEVTTPPPPNVPTATAATSVTNTSFTANWNAVSGATGYYLDVYTKTTGGNASDLFISEYVEGSSNNKGIEIYNGTGASVDLSSYSLKQYNNGATIPTYTLGLSGTLANGSVYRIVNSNQTIFGTNYDLSTSLSVMGFNGNDAVAIFNGANLVDVVGPIGDASDWGKDVTLVRKEAASVPSAIYSASDWDSYAADTITNWGSHTFSGSTTVTYVSGYQNLNVGNVTSYNVDTGRAPGTTYYYVVRAYNAYGTSGNSNEQEVVTLDGPVPVELASFTATISAQNYITLTWVTQTETGMRGYYIYRGTDSDFAGAQNVSPLIPSLNSSQMQTYMFEDTEVYETGTYYYWLQTNDLDGTVNYHGPVSVFYNSLGDNPTPEIPLATKLHAVYPNPFNPLVFIPFSLAKDNDVSFKIYNSRGQIVKHFELGNKAPGNYRITWDGTDYNGNTLSNGVYQIVMTAGSQVYQTKTTLLK